MELEDTGSGNDSDDEAGEQPAPTGPTTSGPGAIVKKQTKERKRQRGKGKSLSRYVPKNLPKHDSN